MFLKGVEKTEMTKTRKNGLEDVLALDFNGQRVQSGIGEFLQRIIHKTVLRHTRLARERCAANAHAEMGAVAQTVGARMARVGLAFVQHHEGFGRQGIAQRGLKRRLGGNRGFTHGS